MINSVTMILLAAGAVFVVRVPLHLKHDYQQEKIQKEKIQNLQRQIPYLQGEAQQKALHDLDHLTHFSISPIPGETSVFDVSTMNEAVLNHLKKNLEKGNIVLTARGSSEAEIRDKLTKKLGSSFQSQIRQWSIYLENKDQLFNADLLAEEFNTTGFRIFTDDMNRWDPSAKTWYILYQLNTALGQIKIHYGAAVFDRWTKEQKILETQA